MDIGVIGLGLIGGSLTRALAAGGHAVLGYDANPGTRATARTAAAQAPADRRWQVTNSLPSVVNGRELVIVAVPPPAVPEVLAGIAASGYPGLVTDVTSVKVPVHRAAERSLVSAGFVGGHPMAGRETAGFAAADPALFDGCAWALCLQPQGTVLADWLAVAALVTSLGARVVPTTPSEHDRAVARVSHLPHLLAAALAGTAAGDPLALTLAAGSFRDGTRVAASPPSLSAAMCAGNADAVREALDELSARLDQARHALDGPDPLAALRSWFAPAAQARAGWPYPPSEQVSLPARVDVLLRLGRAGGWVTGVADGGRHVTAARPAP